MWRLLSNNVVLVSQQVDAVRRVVSYRARKYTPLGSAIEVELCMRSLVVVRCCLIVCLVSQIGPRIRISDNGRHDADEFQLFHGVIATMEMGAVS